MGLPLRISEESEENAQEEKQIQFGPLGKQPKVDLRKLLRIEQEFLETSALTWLKLHYNDQDRPLVKLVIGLHGLSVLDCDMQDKDWDLILQVMSECKSVKRFEFSSGLDSLRRRTKEFKEPKLHIKSLLCSGSIGENEIEDFLDFAMFSRSTKVAFSSCNLDDMKIMVLVEKLKKLRSQVNDEEKQFKLTISQSNTITGTGFSSLAEIPKAFDGISFHLIIDNCGLNDKSLRTFKEKLGGSKLHGISIRNNHNISQIGFEILGEITNCCKASSVTMKNCNLNAKTLGEFVEKAGDSEVEYLNLSSNHRLSDGKLKSVDKAVKFLKVKKLNLADCALKRFEMKRDVDNLVVNNNPALKITEAAKRANEELSACNCRLLTAELERLSKELKDQNKKLQRLCLSEEDREIDGSKVLFLARQFGAFVKNTTMHCSGAERLHLNALQREMLKLELENECEISISFCVKLVIEGNQNRATDSKGIEIRRLSQQGSPCGVN